MQDADWTLKQLATIFSRVVSIFGQPFVKRFSLSYRTVVRLSVLSVTLVYCGQTAGWIKMPLGMEVGLDLFHIVLDEDPAPPLR